MAANPFRGIPKSEWNRVKAEIAAAKEHAAMPQANEFATVIPPDIAAALEAEPPAPKPVNSEPPAGTPIPRNLFSGDLKALDVYGLNGSSTDPIPGYRLYWFNDVAGTGVRLNQAKLSGWEFVSKDEVALNENLVPGNNDLGSNVCKVVNPNVTPPTRAWLMKKPRWLDEAHSAEREKIHERIESALKRGTLSRKPENRQYVAGEQSGSTLPPIDISSNVYRPKGELNG